MMMWCMVVYMWCRGWCRDVQSMIGDSAEDDVVQGWFICGVGGGVGWFICIVGGVVWGGVEDDQREC